MNRTLDVGLRQIAVNLDGDGTFRWHHRLLLVPIGDSRWVWATPDHEIQFGDLGDHQVILLQRNAEFPRRVRDQLYAFDPLAAGDLERLMAEGRSLAALLGVKSVLDDGAAGLEVWRVSSLPSAHSG